MGLVDLLLGVVVATLVGAGIGLGAMSDAEEIEFRIARVCFIGAAIAIVSAYFFWWQQDERPVSQTIVLGLIVLSWIVVVFPLQIKWLSKREGRAQEAHELKPNDRSSGQKIEEPDVTMRLVGIRSPALELINNSNITAHQIKWCVVLWNLDNPRYYSFWNHEEDDHEPLPIPVAIFDYLRGMKKSIKNLFSSPNILPHIKEGDRLVGSASIDCPSSSKAHTYFIYIKYGAGGWYSEVVSEKAGDIIIPSQLKRNAVLRYADEILSETAEANRIPILDF